ncbi:MAG TPA: hypothetical protein PK640_21375 [Verrucomicrobiota bacterium]|nr:hypothetical protein [Verrucomicrobiota bacterium]
MGTGPEQPIHIRTPARNGRVKALARALVVRFRGKGNQSTPVKRADATHSRRLHWGLHVIAGALLVALGLVPTCFLELAGCWLSLRDPLVESGCIVILLGWVTYRPSIARASAGLALGISLSVLGLGAAECLGRWTRWDFRKTEATLHRLPPYYRKPTVLTGDVFFRRPGPERWKGRVIEHTLRELGIGEDLYADELEITVQYDAQGFRNPAGLTDWDMAVAGDSFTELGFLPENLLFTSLLSRRLGLRVKNLGVSHTGPLTQLHYLEAYGLGPSTRRVAIMFFEGNDLQDLEVESHRLRWFQQTGKHPSGQPKPQCSLLRAICDLVLRPVAPAGPAAAPAPDAHLDVAGKRVAVDFGSVPVAASDMKPRLREAFDDFLIRYRGWARERGLEAWLFYLPAPLRVWQGRLDFTEQAPEQVRMWQPTDLPDHVGELAQAHGLRFCDLTPALIEATRTREALLFNPRFDTHLNAAGSAVVAEAMARVFEQD